LLHFHATSVMMPCEPPAITHSPVLGQKLGNPNPTCFAVK
jgi:hypothetical protein